LWPADDGDVGMRTVLSRAEARATFHGNARCWDISMPCFLSSCDLIDAFQCEAVVEMSVSVLGELADFIESCRYHAWLRSVILAPSRPGPVLVGPDRFARFREIFRRRTSAFRAARPKLDHSQISQPSVCAKRRGPIAPRGYYQPGGRPIRTNSHDRRPMWPCWRHAASKQTQ
jgi:hypothetical protein